MIIVAANWSAGIALSKNRSGENLFHRCKPDAAKSIYSARPIPKSRVHLKHKKYHRRVWFLPLFHPFVYFLPPICLFPSPCLFISFPLFVYFLPSVCLFPSPCLFICLFPSPCLVICFFPPSRMFVFSLYFTRFYFISSVSLLSVTSTDFHDSFCLLFKEPNLPLVVCRVIRPSQFYGQL